MANRLRSLRRARGLTQEQVAASIGTTKQHYGRLENSKRGIGEHWTFKLSQAFGVEPTEIWHDPGEGSLSQRERNLVDVFRKMDERRQTAFMEAVDALARSWGTGE